MEVVDLFAGPGGLSEGFRRLGMDSGEELQVALSVEMDRWAVETLRLRALSRLHGNHDLISAQLRNVRGSLSSPDWMDTAPAAWKEVLEEVRQLRLGTDEAREIIFPKLDRIRERNHGDTILIGGPPCQAYSLVGRARNRGILDYVPEDDHRHYLYREYVSILDRLRPAAFVMENVKGILSSKINGEEIFQRILDDLSCAGDGYTLVPLSAPFSGAKGPVPADFIVRAELHGVPQARHRVIILGIRNDLAGSISEGEVLLPPRHPEEAVSVRQALSGLLPLRSGLSSGDDARAWQAEVLGHMGRIRNWKKVPAQIREDMGRLAEEFVDRLPLHRVATNAACADVEMPDELRKWLRIGGTRSLANHATRGHMTDDLSRYLYASSFARVFGVSPKLEDFHSSLLPNHRNRHTGKFADRFRVQLSDRPSTTVTSHISKDGHYYIHPDPVQCRSLTVREAARLQTFPDDYVFMGPRTAQYHQVGNAVPPFLAGQIACSVLKLLGKAEECDARRQKGTGVGTTNQMVECTFS